MKASAFDCFSGGDATTTAIEHDDGAYNVGNDIAMGAIVCKYLVLPGIRLY